MRTIGPGASTMVESAKDTLKAPAHCNFRLSNNAPIAELYLIKIDS